MRKKSGSKFIFNVELHKFVKYKDKKFITNQQLELKSKYCK